MVKHYVVISPEYKTYCGDDFDPPEYGCDVVYIHAENKRDAKSFALRTKEFENWLKEAKWCMINPFSGLNVELTLCSHGWCYCGCSGDECLECEKDDSNTTT